MQPTDYPPGWPVQPHAGVLPTATQTDQPTENTFENMFSVFQATTSGFFSELGETIFAVDDRVTNFFDAVENKAICVFNNFFPEKHSILILSADMINQVFTDITDEEDLYSLTVTCKTLFEMGRAPHIRLRTRDYRIISSFGEQFNEKSVQLILAVNARALNHNEFTIGGVSPVQYQSSAQQQIDAEHAFASKKCEKEFYAVFKVRCLELNVKPGCAAFTLCVRVVFKNLNKKSLSLNTHSETMPLKLKTTENNFKENIFNDIIKAYANQPIEAITPDSFKEKVAELRALLPLNSIVYLEVALRVAFRAHHRGAIGAFAAQYLDPTPCNPNVEKIKCDFKAELELCKAKTQARMSELCGEHFNGTINTAYQRMIAAEAELNAAMSALRATFGQGFTLIEALSLDMLNAAVTDSIRDAHATLVAKDSVFVAAKAQFEQLRAELDTLAVWTRGNITGGAIFDIDTKLANLDVIARTEATKLGKFYEELSKQVSTGQEGALSAALHRIID